MFHSFHSEYFQLILRNLCQLKDQPKGRFIGKSKTEKTRNCSQNEVGGFPCYFLLFWSFNKLLEFSFTLIWELLT